MTTQRRTFRLIKNYATQVSEWHQVKFEDLREGDIFRLEEPSGEPVRYLGTDGVQVGSLTSGKMVAMGDAYSVSWNAETGSVWGIEAEGYNS